MFIYLEKKRNELWVIQSSSKTKISFLTQKVIYIDIQIGKEMHVNLAQYHLYQQFNVNECRVNLNMTLH